MATGTEGHAGKIFCCPVYCLLDFFSALFSNSESRQWAFPWVPQTGSRSEKDERKERRAPGIFSMSVHPTGACDTSWVFLQEESGISTKVCRGAGTLSGCKNLQIFPNELSNIWLIKMTGNCTQNHNAAFNFLASWDPSFPKIQCVTGNGFSCIVTYIQSGAFLWLV